MTSKSPNRLTVTKEQMAQAGRTVGLGSVQTDRMWDQLVSSAPVTSTFNAAQVAWYFGAAIVLVAMGWLIAIVGSSYGAGALLTMSVAYTGIFTYVGWTLASQRDLRIPGGLLYALAVVMTPVTVSAINDNFHLNFHGDGAIPALLTAVVGLAFTRVTRISLLALPTLLAAWIGVTLGADQWFAGHSVTWEAVSVGFGLLTLLGSFLLDGKTDGEDYSFWGYAVGAVATYAGLTFMGKDEMGYLLYAGGGILTMLASVALSRRIFAFAGAAAVLTWVGHVSVVFFANSVLFPVALTAIGIATIAGGVLYHRNSDSIDAAILGLVPAGLRARLPRR